MTVTGVVLGVVGAALLIYEGVRATLLNDVLGSVGQVLLWVGLGVMALGGILLVAAVWSPPREPAAAGPGYDTD